MGERNNVLERLELLARLEAHALLILPACGLRLTPAIRAAWTKLDLPDLRSCADRYAQEAAKVSREQPARAEQERLFILS
jgi:hypothetical protein